MGVRSGSPSDVRSRVRVCMYVCVRVNEWMGRSCGCEVDGHQNNKGVR
jgi:hypothetical protein